MCKKQENDIPCITNYKCMSVILPRTTGEEYTLSIDVWVCEASAF
jgi:hypothetical protein